MASNDEQRSATTIFTTAAQSIAARLIANKTTAQFTKAEISTTNLFNQSVTELQVLTSLDNVQQTADINTVTVINDSTVDVNIAIDQTKAPNDYQMNSVGLFAVDGDGKEVLYSVTVLKDPIYIHQDAMGSALGIDLETVVGQSSNVDLSINPAGAVTNEALKVTLADYVKTDDVEKLIPATVIDGSKPADFKEAVTLEKGAVDGAGNTIATTKDLADGDAETLTSAKDYADTQTSGKADDKDLKFNELTDGTDLFSLIANSERAGYYLCSSNRSALTLKNTPVSTAFSLVIYPSNTSQAIAENGNPKWAYTQMVLRPFNSSDEWVVSTNTDGEGNISSTSWVKVANDANMFHRSPDTGTVAESGNFPGLQVKGVDVATAADLKSLEASAWHILKLDSSNSEVYVNGSMLYKIDTEKKIFQAVFNGYTSPTKQLDKKLDFVDLSSLVDKVTSLSLQYALNTSETSTILDYEINGAQITTTTSYKLYLRNSGDVMLSTPPADGKLYVEIGYNELNKKEEP